MRYFLQDPDGNEYDISRYITRGLETVSEIAFDLDGPAVPSDLTLEVNNIDGVFDPGRGLFSYGELTRWLVIVTGKNREDVLFIGTVTDLILTETANASIETRSVIASLLQCSFNMASVTTWGSTVVATPSRIVADLLGPNGLKLPGIFIDAQLFDLFESAEEDIGLKYRLQIPTGENVAFTDFLQELNRTCSAYVYSYNGFLRYTRLGGAEREGYDHTFSGEILAGTVKASRPVLWQKTKAVAKYWDGAAVQKLESTMADYFPVVGETIMEDFREKTLESDGLGGYLVHNSLASANIGLQDVLGWRGRPRWTFEFEVDALAADVRSKALAMPLLARLRILYSGGCAKLIVKEKQTNNQKSVFKCLSMVEPTFIHPARRRLPVVEQVTAHVKWTNNTGADIKLYYKIGAGAELTATIAPASSFSALHLNESVTWWIAEGLPCGELPSPKFVFTPTPVAGFLLGISLLGDPL
jgi:hypothetical protein